MTQVARTALVSLALGALSQWACVPDNDSGGGTGGRGGTGGTGGAGGTGGSVGTGGTGGTVGTGGSGGRTPDGRAPDRARTPDGRAPDRARTPDGRAPDGGSRDTGGNAAGVRMAVATIQPYAPNGGTITGTVTFLEVPGGVRVTYAVENCPPGAHLTHIHAGANCTNPAGQGHWAPPRGEMINNTNMFMCGQDQRGTFSYTRMSGTPNLTWTIGPPAVSDILQHPVVIHGAVPNVVQGCGVIQLMQQTQPVANPY